MKNFILSLWQKYKYWEYERKCIKHFGAKPEKIYLPQKDYDALVEMLNKPPDPDRIEKFKAFMNRKSPWEE